MSSLFLSQIVSGSTLGLFAGLAPGPMLALVLAQTIQYSAGEGIKVATAPLVTDPPIIALAWLLFLMVSGIQFFMGVVSFFGALYLGYLGLEAIRVTSADLNLQAQRPRSLQKGILTNFLNPHPYLFWFSVGVPILVSPGENQAVFAAIFLVCFYCFLVGSQMTLTLIAGKGRGLIQGRVYPWIMRGLGIALWIFGLLFLVKGLRIFLA